MAARQPRGFTLIEVLVVVFIIGVIVGMATLSFSGRALDDLAQEEARRLAEIFRLASEEATLTGLEIGWISREGRYRFVALSDQGWTTYGDGTPLRPRELPEPLTVTVRIEDLALTEEEERAAPQLMFLSSGEITPFEVDLGAPQLAVRFQISGNLLGQLKLERLDAKAL